MNVTHAVPYRHPNACGSPVVMDRPYRPEHARVRLGLGSRFALYAVG